MADHLEAAAEALRASMFPEERLVTRWHKTAAKKIVSSYLDSLLGELPEEAVEAARRQIDGGGESYYIAWGYPDEDEVRGKLDADAMTRNSAEALLTSLRDSLVSGRQGPDDG